MAKHIVIANQKGGVGKTTTAVNLTASLHAAGKSVLLCDFDPQANATSGLGVDKNAVSPNIYDILIDGADVERGVVQTPWGDVLPSNKELAGAGVEMIGMDRREYLLREALDRLSDRYDYILIDCPPSLELLTLNGLCAADSVLIPVQCEYYALEGLSDLLSTVRIVKKKLNPSITIEGVLLTMYDGRTNLSIQVAARCTPPSSPETSGSVKPPATGNRRWPMTSSPEEQKPIKNWRKRYWNKTLDCFT